VQIALYVRTVTGVLWGPKPGVGVSTAVNADGTFSIANWASGGVGDAQAPALVAFALPAGVAPATILGGAAPAALTGAAVATAVSTRGAGGGVVPPPPPPPPAGGAAALAVTAPALGSGAAITGRLSGIPIAGQRVSHTPLACNAQRSVMPPPPPPDCAGGRVRAHRNRRAVGPQAPARIRLLCGR